MLDTNVVSEWAKPHRNDAVARWCAELDEDSLFLSVITLSELRHGVDRMPPGAKRERLDAWLRSELLDRFEDRVLAVDVAAADSAGRIIARCRALGRPIGAMDALIAGIADSRGLTLATRNVSYFEPCGIAIVDPWRQSGG